MMTSFVQHILKSDSGAPLTVWRHFEQFCLHPRPSKNEEKIKKYIIAFAESNKLSWKKDKVGNVIIYIPGSEGFQKSKPVLIQNHIDMVTDAIPEKIINFLNDPIEPYVDGDWVKAKGTTLGADNGIGSSMALALIDHQKEFIHPPLELLFTVDEETGLTGALELDPSMIQSSRMINLDTEEWGALYIGCAGGMDVRFNAEISTQEDSGIYYSLKIQGLFGGHSGLDIHRQRGNAIVLGIDFITSISDSVKLIQIEGGKAHNIIPRNSNFIFALNDLSEIELNKKFEKWKQYVQSILPKEDLESLVITLEQRNGSYKYIQRSFWQEKFKYFLQFFPNGAHKFELESKQEEPLVRLSNNFALCSLKEGAFKALTSIRFFKQDEGVKLKNQCVSLATLAGISYEVRDGYPSWTPDFGATFLKKISQLYIEKFSLEPKVKAIHAGLECGIILAKKPGMQAISLGPCIKDAHSPEEKVLIADVRKTWEFLIFVLSRLVE